MLTHSRADICINIGGSQNIRFLLVRRVKETNAIPLLGEEVLETNEEKTG